MAGRDSLARMAMGLVGVAGQQTDRWSAGRRSSVQVHPGFSAALDSVPSEKGDDHVVVCLPAAGVANGHPCG